VEKPTYTVHVPTPVETLALQAQGSLELMAASLETFWHPSVSLPVSLSMHITLQ